MNMKKLAVGIMSSAMVLSMGVGAYADSEIDLIQVTPAKEITISTTGERENFKTQLTEEEIAQRKAEIEDKIADQKEKWNALSDSEKSELTKLAQEARTLQKEMIQKYLELGLIDEDQADQMLERLEEQATLESENGCLSLMGMGKGMGRGLKIGFENQTNSNIKEATQTTPATLVEAE